jgi:hypothetical protein
MLAEDQKISETLRKIVCGFTSDQVLQQDMLQECLLWLCRVERDKPGRTLSWYLQSCRFHIQHWLASGRSVDSLKRNRADKRIAIEGNDDEPALQEYHTNGELFEGVSFQDVVSTLGLHLKPRERRVLRGLAEGQALREIAAELRLSYPTALKCRQTIATVISKLEISPPPGSGRESLAD